MLALLLKSIDPKFNESYFISTVTDSVKKSAFSTIDSQRSLITKLQNQLLHSNQPLGTVTLSLLPSTSASPIPTFSNYDNNYMLSYSSHRIERAENTAFHVYVYDARFIYEQIRDYIGEYEPLGIQYLQATLQRITFKSNSQHRS